MYTSIDFMNLKYRIPGSILSRARVLHIVMLILFTNYYIFSCLFLDPMFQMNTEKYIHRPTFWPYPRNI